MYEWVLVAVLMTTNDVSVVDYYKTKKDCMVTRNQQTNTQNKNYMCLLIDKV